MLSLFCSAAPSLARTFRQHSAAAQPTGQTRRGRKLASAHAMAVSKRTHRQETRAMSHSTLLELRLKVTHFLTLFSNLDISTNAFQN